MLYEKKKLQSFKRTSCHCVTSPQPEYWAAWHPASLFGSQTLKARLTLLALWSIVSFSLQFQSLLYIVCYVCVWLVSVFLPMRVSFSPYICLPHRLLFWFLLFFCLFFVPLDSSVCGLFASTFKLFNKAPHMDSTQDYDDSSSHSDYFPITVQHWVFFLLLLFTHIWTKRN